MKKELNALFIGWYPNSVDKYKNIFFQNIIFEMARQGVNCTVISPVSLMKYRTSICKIPFYIKETVGKNIFVDTYYPKTISASSIQIGSFNTEKISEYAFETAALNCVKSLKKKFDFVYGHFFLYGGLAAIKIGRVLGIPSFVAYGECDFESQVMKTYGVPKKKEIEGLKGIISVSKKNADELNEIGFVKNIPMIIEPNAVDIGIFRKLDKKKSRQMMNFPQDKYIVGFVGGFIERKGDKRLLQAVNNIDDAYVAFAGRGDDRPSGNKVIFAQGIEHDLIPIFLNAVDVFCLPTLAEGSCNAIVEAMACGLPVISSNLPFNDDVLNESNSIKINPMSINEIQDAIEKLKDVDIRTELSNNAYFTAQKLSISLRATRIIDFIVKCIRER